MSHTASIALRHVCKGKDEPCRTGSYHLGDGNGRALCGEPAWPTPLDPQTFIAGIDFPCPECLVKRSEQAMDELVSLFASRDDVAEEYAACLTTYPAHWDRWSDFNGAILRRWSPAGLRYVKDKGWKIASRAAREDGTRHRVTLRSVMARQGIEPRRGPISILPEEVSDQELDDFLKAVNDL